MEAGNGNSPKLGEFVHLASVDPAAPPGRLRLFLRSEDEVRKFYAPLHGQTVQVGQDLVAIEISNDIINAASLLETLRGGGRMRPPSSRLSEAQLTLHKTRFWNSVCGLHGLGWLDY